MVASQSHPHSLFDHHAVQEAIAPQVGTYQGTQSEIEPVEEYTPRVLTPHWYQTQSWADIDEGFFVKGYKSQLLVLPAGCGKTLVCSRWIKGRLELGESVLVLCDLDRLIEQMNDDLHENGIRPLLEKAEFKARRSFGIASNSMDTKCVLASMQTLHPLRLTTWPPDTFDWIVIDEAHELRYVKILEYFNTARVLGMTATPKPELKKYFHHPYIRKLTLRQAIEGWNAETGQYEKPFLTRILVHDEPAHHIDLSKIKLVDVDGAMDFSQIEVAKAMWDQTEWLASVILKFIEHRRAWIYCPRIPVTDAITKALRDMGASIAAYHSKLADPKANLERWKRDEIQHLANVNMLIKGVNEPKVDCIIRLRPSLDTAMVTQEIGRGSRLSPQTGKQNALIVQFSFNTKLKLAGIVDSIMDGADDPDKPVSQQEQFWRNRLRERTDKIIKTKAEMDLIKAHDLAKAQLKAEDAAKAELEEKEREDRRRKFQQVDIQLKGQVYDPCSGLKKPQIAGDSAVRPSRATPQQIARIIELSGGLSPNQLFTAESADKRIRELEIRQQHKYASEKQLLMLGKLGCDPKQARYMRKWEAHAWIDAELARRKMEGE